ncbi:hypothetical protein [Methanobrevibacter sp.]
MIKRFIQNHYQYISIANIDCEEFPHTINGLHPSDIYKFISIV